MNHFQLVADHSDTYPVKRLCRVIDIARSSYYAWLGAADARAAGDVELDEKNRRPIHTDDNTYGRARITAEINHGQPADTRATSWMLRHPDNLADDEQIGLKRILASCPGVEATAGHVKSFAEMLTGRLGKQLNLWTSAVSAVGVPHLRRFVHPAT